MNIELTCGFRLTEIRRSDREALVGQLNDEEIYDLTLAIPFPYMAADADDWLTLIEQQTKEAGHPLTWAIRDKHDKLIGAVGLRSPGKSGLHRAEIGYWLAKPFWGQGIMTSAAKAICQHAFETLGLVKINAHVFSFNPGSARVLEKCGFEQEGTLRKHALKDGKLIDVKAYGLIR
jgi:ribosomal-protein-alanine N-acetyltransferase